MCQPQHLVCQPQHLTFVVATPPPEPARPVPGQDREPLAADPTPTGPAASQADQTRHPSDRQEGRPGGQSLAWTDVYIKLKVSFRRSAMRRLKGGGLSVWLCLALHVDKHGISAPGVKQIMRETGYSKATVCSALEELCSPGLNLVERLPSGGGRTRYRPLGYAWIGRWPAPSLFEAGEGGPKS